MPITASDWAALDRNVDAWDRGDLEAWQAAAHPTDVSWRAALLEELVGEQTYEGPDGMRRFWQEWRAGWSEYRIEILGREEVGGRMLVHTHGTGRGSASGIEVGRELWWLVEMKDGLPSHGASFLTEEDARAAATRP